MQVNSLRVMDFSFMGALDYEVFPRCAPSLYLSSATTCLHLAVRAHFFVL